MIDGTDNVLRYVLWKLKYDIEIKFIANLKKGVRKEHVSSNWSANIEKLDPSRMVDRRLLAKLLGIHFSRMCLGQKKKRGWIQNLTSLLSYGLIEKASLARESGFLTHRDREPFLAVETVKLRGRSFRKYPDYS